MRQRPDPNVRRLLPRQSSELVVLDITTGISTVIYDAQELFEAPNWTLDGRWLVYNADGRLWRISPDGSDGPHRINTAPVEDLNNDHLLAPDGINIYVSANDSHLYVVPLTGGTPKRITGDQGDNYRHYLHGVSPDGATLAYVALSKVPGGIFTRLALVPSAGGEPTYLTDGSYQIDGPEYTPDGAWIYYNGEAAARRPGHAQLFRMRPDGTGIEQLTHDDRVNWFPHLSPDGAWMVYISFPQGTLGHPADKAVILRLARPDGSDIRDLDAFNGGQGTINVPSWAPGSDRLAYVRYPVA
ncbi:MAG: biopolymer transporter Tol [Pseudorhodobacter sp.]|nr:biopolymer transporter Tol [Pseudorhodobacter sp.]